MELKYKSSILLSIFRRKGGEGALTKIINSNNKFNYSVLEEEEQALILYEHDRENWLLLTNNRILEKKEKRLLSIYYCNLLTVRPAIEYEFRLGVMNKEEFTYLYVENYKYDGYILKVEQGQPYQGIYQVLHYIMSVNKPCKS
ncbi:hypothetical protein G7051_07880 [Dysgonomonas sp. HDW5B]|uniref:hypothetical protein n=1 Tax=Dysgonomonas sp. HDW5B TaxID=2714927 RepID=UPI00140D40EA|nr:hypothetical protein [Dysgonomonas sp. HDW5B]QIK54261.1 hypothetical protein G7051_07880 [Dysgonomonas sp. HDW5B]